MNTKISNSFPFYKFIDHTADIGIIVEAQDVKDLFIKAAFSLIHIIIGKIPEGKKESVEVKIEGEDLIDLMVNWLSEILYMLEGEKKIMTKAEIISFSPKQISAVLSLIPFDEKEHEIQCEIKAVTYHQLNIYKENSRWKANIIFDV